MINEKPLFDREQTLLAEARERRIRHALKVALNELHPGESLGTPTRKGSVLLIPIIRDNNAPTA